MDNFVKILDSRSKRTLEEQKSEFNIDEEKKVDDGENRDQNNKMPLKRRVSWQIKNNDKNREEQKEN